MGKIGRVCAGTMRNQQNGATVYTIRVTVPPT